MDANARSSPLTGGGRPPRHGAWRVRGADGVLVYESDGVNS